MPLSAKRRKVAATTAGPVAAPGIQRSIQAFGKISKSQAQTQGKSTLSKASISENANGRGSSNAIASRKRKLGTADVHSDKHNIEKATDTDGKTPLPEDCSIATEDPLVVLSSERPSPPTAQPTTPRKRAFFTSNITETPTKGARSRLESLSLPSSPSNHSSPPTVPQHETPPSSPVSSQSSTKEYDGTNGLPEELQDLVNLHSSLLTALSLHYAHNGSMSPADLRNLGPSVERAWRKRRVTTDDMRRILALQRKESRTEPGPLDLSDYGSGKICIEISNSRHSQRAQKPPVNEEELNTVFLRNLELQWNAYKAAHKGDLSPQAFITSLPLLTINLCTSLSKLAPLLSKGQRRLEDLKAGAIRAQQTPLSTISANATSAPAQKAKQTNTRSTELFSRIKAKQLRQSTLALPPSTEVLARKSALQRLPEVAPVMESLAVSSKKHANDDAVTEVSELKVSHTSFTMPTLVQHLQMSLRNPIGKDEAIRCVRLLAEMAPEWMGIRYVGKTVVLTMRGDGLDRKETGRRIDGMVEQL